MSRHAGTRPASTNSGSPSISASCPPLEIAWPAATSSLDMYTAPAEPPPVAEPPPPAEPPAADPVPDAPAAASGADGYTSYCVAGYTTPRIWTDEVRIWETTFAVVTVGGGAAESAAICCGDFTSEDPISPPMASRAAPPATQNRARRRRASRDPRTACRPWSLGSLSVAGEPSCVTRSSLYRAHHRGFRRSRQSFGARHESHRVVRPSGLCVICV